jgi:hypothetical protein
VIANPTCPSEAEVKAELVRLGAERSTYPEISFTGGRMRVVLRGRDGATVGSREVEAPAACRERATVTAVLVATWLGIWPEAPVSASPSPPTLPAPPPAPVLMSAVRRTEIGLAVAGGYDGNAAAWAVAIELRRRMAGPWRAWIGLTSTGERERNVGSAMAGYTRPALEMGPAVRLLHGRAQLEVGASARLGAVVVRGKDLPISHLKIHPVPGAASNLRLIWVGEQLSPFIVTTGSYWFGRQQLTLDDDAATADLPRWNAEVGLGLLWAR